MSRPALLALVAVCFALAAPVAADAQSAPDKPQGTIYLSGHGEVSGTPDTAYVTSGVVTQGQTARDALDANTAAMTQLIAVLKAAGIEARDIQTSGFSVNPNYFYTDKTDANGYTLPPRINGYSVANSVTVRVRQLATLGTVLDQAVTVGANTISGITFAVDDTAAIYEKARIAAFADAKAKAGLYAGEAHAGLGAILSITENQGYNQPAPMVMSAMSDKAMGAPVPVEAGQLTFSIDVAVTWALLNP
jgi:uncharacterized protein